MAGKFEINRAAGGKYSFNLKASNGRIILTSESYPGKSAAMGGIESVRKNAGKDANYEHRTSKNGDPYFVLKALNGEIIGTSEMYSTAAAVETGIASVMENAPSAEVEDLTA